MSSVRKRKIIKMAVDRLYGYMDATVLVADPAKLYLT